MSDHRREEHPARKLIRIAEARLSAPSDSEADKNMTTSLERLGMVIGSLRRKKQLAIETLAEDIGLEKDSVLAIELGAAPIEQVLEALPGLVEALEIESYFLSQLLDHLVPSSELPRSPSCQREQVLATLQPKT